MEKIILAVASGIKSLPKVDNDRMSFESSKFFPAQKHPNTTDPKTKNSLSIIFGPI